MNTYFEIELMDNVEIKYELNSYDVISFYDIDGNQIEYTYEEPIHYLLRSWIPNDTHSWMLGEE